jgi:protein MpaA
MEPLLEEGPDLEGPTNAAKSAKYRKPGQNSSGAKSPRTPAANPPAKTPSAKSPSTKAPPANNPPANNPPANNPPAKSPPAKTPSAKSPSMKSPPAKTPPANQSPAKSPSMKAPPAKTPPANQSPNNNPPSNKSSRTRITMRQWFLDSPDPVFIAFATEPDVIRDVPEPMTPPTAGPTVPSGDADEPEIAASESDESDRSGASSIPAESVRSVTTGQSTRGRKFEAIVVGEGPRRVAVIGSLHGDQAQAISMLVNLARELRQRPDRAGGCQVLLVKTGNPDGLADRTELNSRGVDLNRNFPARNWQALANDLAGDRPGSEVETRAIIKLLEDFRPDLLVHLKDSPTTESEMNCEGSPAERIARQVARYGGYRLHSNLGQKTSGSLEAYALERLECPSLTLLLKRELDHEAAWRRHRTAVLSVFRDELEVNSSDWQDDPFHTVSLPEQRPPTKVRRQSSPKSIGDSSTASTRAVTREASSSAAAAPAAEEPAGSPVPETGYFELPPPPPRKP